MPASWPRSRTRGWGAHPRACRSSSSRAPGARPSGRAVARPRPFRFGVIHEAVQSAESWAGHVRRVEDLGFSTFLIRDHFVPDFFGDQPAPLVALASAAALTTRLRVGTMVLAVDYRHPVMLTKEAATLDRLSS